MADKTQIDRHFLERARELESQTIEMRRHLHQNPELSFHEFETSRLMNERLERLGYATTKGVGKTGLLGALGKKGPIIGIRADMDGLPID